MTETPRFRGAFVFADVLADLLAAGQFLARDPAVVIGVDGAEVGSEHGVAACFGAAELAVAIAVAKGCEDCILYHVDAALKHGAKEAELIEALEVAIEMGGGPAVMYGAKALEIMRSLQ